MNCERCGAEATEVHHVDERGGEPGSNADANLEALCRSCHSRHTLHAFREAEPMRRPLTVAARGPSASRPVVGGGLLDRMLARRP